VHELGIDAANANARAWQYGKSTLERTIAKGSSQFVDMITCPWVGGIPGAFERGGTSQLQKIPSLLRHKVRA
jgi:hypothetical protein